MLFQYDIHTHNVWMPVPEVFSLSFSFWHGICYTYGVGTIFYQSYMGDELMPYEKEK